MQLIVVLSDQTNDLTETLTKCFGMLNIDAVARRQTSADGAMTYVIEVSYAYELPQILSVIMAGWSMYYLRWERLLDI